MPRLRLTTRGQLTLPPELVRHLGAQVGDKIKFCPGPNGSAFMELDRNATIKAKTPQRRAQSK